MKMQKLIDRIVESSGIEEGKPLFVVTAGQQKVNAAQMKVQRAASELMYMIRELDALPNEIERLYKGEAKKGYTRVKGKVESNIEAAAVSAEAARRNLGEANVKLIAAIKAMKDVV